MEVLQDAFDKLGGSTHESTVQHMSHASTLSDDHVLTLFKKMDGVLTLVSSTGTTEQDTVMNAKLIVRLFPSSPKTYLANQQIVTLESKLRRQSPV